MAMVEYRSCSVNSCWVYKFIYNIIKTKKKGENNNMNKKSLLIKIVKFIHEANIKYRKSDIGDVWLLIFIILMTMIGSISAMSMTILIFLCLRGIYIFNILERLGVINEEEENKKDDNEIIKNNR